MPFAVISTFTRSDRSELTLSECCKGHFKNNLKIFWGSMPPDCPRRLGPSASPPPKKAKKSSFRHCKMPIKFYNLPPVTTNISLICPLLIPIESNLLYRVYKKKLNKPEIALRLCKAPQCTKFFIEIGCLGINVV